MVGYSFTRISKSYFRFKDEGEYVRVIPVKSSIRSYHRELEQLGKLGKDV
jgi:hypothetical protein